MPTGVQIFNPINGRLVLDSNDIVGLLIGSIQVAENQLGGSVYNPKFANGRPFLVPFINMSTNMYGQGNGRNEQISSSQITFSVSNGTLSWSRPQRAPYEPSSPAGILYYGIYSSA